jgi:hypothetical protein
MCTCQNNGDYCDECLAKFEGETVELPRPNFIRAYISRDTTYFEYEAFFDAHEDWSDDDND